MEILIIGAGPGGYVAALYAAKRGLKVILIDKAETGGTCLNRGCIPTKAILHSAKLFHQSKSLANLGINVTVNGIDYSQIYKRSSDIITRLRRGVDSLLKKAGVTVIRGRACLLAGNKVRVTIENEERLLTADKIVIATGAQPAVIPVAPVDGNVILNSDHVLALTELPESMAIIGGGVIGCEFAQAFARLGCRVTVIEALPRLASEMDTDVSELLHKVLERDGVKIHLNACVTSVDKAEATVFFDTPQGNIECTAQKVLVAAGRKPKLDNLGLEAAGINYANGFIEVDKHMQTNVPGIYAIGDVSGGIQLAHAASYGGIAAVKHMLNEDADMSGICVPVCVYTDPEIACIGLTFDGAKKAGYDCRTGVFPVSANSRAMIEGSTDGFAKTVLDADGTILGAQLAGPNATEMISLLGGLINFQTAASDMEEIIFAHPSVSEIIGECVLAADKMALHIP